MFSIVEITYGGDFMKLTKELPSNKDAMIQAMQQCEQTKGQTVYQHGLSVKDYACELIDHLRDGNDLKYEWRLPDWIFRYKEELLNNIDCHFYDYLLYHDCGKPYCRIVDDNLGTIHFPDHAKTSKFIWTSIGGNELVGLLIGYDMIIHTATAVEVQSYCEEWDIHIACMLIIAALAEIHSNAVMFGGIEAVSFKSKWKKVTKRCKQICKLFFGDR